MSGRRVLVVEDSDVGGRTLTTVLRAAGYDVRWEKTGHAARRTAATWEPHAVVLDRRLPDGMGDSIAPEFRLHNDRTRVIVLSGEPAPGVVDSVDQWLVKPVSNRALLAAVAGDNAARDREASS